jgi:uncharacterized protein YbjQ (UPF0145 family)
MVELLTLIVLLGLGYGFGRRAESQHYASIKQGEERLRGLMILQTRFPPALEPAPRSVLVSGNVVIAVDFFKVFVAGLRNLIGGRMVSYESLLDRARREAVLRMKEEAHALGATLILNVKLDTASLYKGQQGSIQSIEAFAYGTALIPGEPRAL